MTRDSAIADTPARRTVSVGMLSYCCANNANRSRVSLKTTFNNCHVLFGYLHCTHIVAVGSTIAQWACILHSIASQSSVDVFETPCRFCVVFRPASDGRRCARRSLTSPDVLPAGSGRLLPAVAGRRQRAGTSGRRWTTPIHWRPLCRTSRPPCRCLPACHRAGFRLPADVTL